MSDLDSRLRDALRELAPTHPGTDGLAANAQRYAARARRTRRAGFAGATAGAVAVAVLAAGSFDRADKVQPTNPLLTSADCSRQAATPTIPSADGQPLDAFGASWVCPDLTAPESGDEADGWRLPTDMLTARSAPGLYLGGRVDEANCGSTPLGPPFTLTFEGRGGQLTTYRSRELSCGGAYTMASFLKALADDEADAYADSLPDDQLACRSLQWWLEARGDDPSLTFPARTPSSIDTPLVDGILCLAPRYLRSDSLRPIRRLVPKSYVSIHLSTDVLAMVNADLKSTKSFFTGNGACRGEGAWEYSILGLTAEGERHMLVTGCLDEFFIDGTRAGFVPSVETTARLRALVPPA